MLDQGLACNAYFPHSRTVGRALAFCSSALDEEQGEDGLAFSERLPDSKPSPEELCSAAEARGQLVEGVRQLSPKLRRAFQLRDMDGLTTKEAALVLGVPHGTVKAQLARARAKLARSRT